MRTMVMSFKPDVYERIACGQKYLNTEEHFQTKQSKYICM